MRLRVFERVANDAMHTLVGVHLFLNRHLIISAGLESPTDADVHAFRVLAKDDEVDVLAAAVLEGAEPIVDQSNGAVIDEEIELEASAEQNVAGVAVVGDARIAERPDEDGVELA